MSTRFQHAPGGYAIIQCDRCEQTASRWVDDSVVAYTPEVRAFWREVAGKGWTFWSSSRSLRTYCPYCKPRPGHRMHEVTDMYAKEN